MPAVCEYSIALSIVPIEFDCDSSKFRNANDKDKDKYRMYFDKSKEHPEKISFGKAYLMWKSLNVHDNVIKKIKNNSNQS